MLTFFWFQPAFHRFGDNADSFSSDFQFFKNYLMWRSQVSDQIPYLWIIRYKHYFGNIPNGWLFSRARRTYTDIGFARSECLDDYLKTHAGVFFEELSVFSSWLNTKRFKQFGSSEQEQINWLKTALHNEVVTKAKCDPGDSFLTFTSFHLFSDFRESRRR